jgi:hypothetical protein
MVIVLHAIIICPKA